MDIITPDPLVGIFANTTLALVKRAGPDLTARQMAVFLITYLDNEAQTVRSLAARLSVPKPAVTRALDRLGEFDLVRRKEDPADHRSVLVQRTLKGHALLRDLTKIITAATKAPEKKVARRTARVA